MTVLRNGIRMQETANKQKRMALKTVHEMLDAKKVHLLFMGNSSTQTMTSVMRIRWRTIAGYRFLIENENDRNYTDTSDIIVARS